MTRKSSPKKKNSLQGNVLILCIFLSLAGLALVYALDYFEQTNAQFDSTADEQIEFTIAASRLKAPKSWVISAFNPEKTVLNALQLKLDLIVEMQSTSVIVTLLPASRAAPSAYLLDSLYIHNFAPGRTEQMFGLVVKKLKNEAGFEDEIVWYDALSANPFVAKCLEEKTVIEDAKNCITTVLVNKRVSALIQFEKSILPHWRPFAVALDRQLAELNAD